MHYPSPPPTHPNHPGTSPGGKVAPRGTGSGVVARTPAICGRKCGRPAQARVALGSVVGALGATRGNPGGTAAAVTPHRYPGLVATPKVGTGSVWRETWQPAPTSLTCQRYLRRRFAVANSREVVVGAAVEGEASWVTHSDYPSALGVAGTCGELATAKRRRGSSEEAQESIRD